jgi:hypothetical protein
MHVLTKDIVVQYHVQVRRRHPEMDVISFNEMVRKLAELTKKAKP